MLLERITYTVRGNGRLLLVLKKRKAAGEVGGNGIVKESVDSKPLIYLFSFYLLVCFKFVLSRLSMRI